MRDLLIERWCSRDIAVTHHSHLTNHQWNEYIAENEILPSTGAK